MTGRAAGLCAGNPVPGFANPAWGGGFYRGGPGRGRGGGRRHRHWFFATGLTGWQRAAMDWPAYWPWSAAPFGPVLTRDQELEMLKRQAEYFAQALEELNQRIGEVESPKAGSH